MAQKISFKIFLLISSMLVLLYSKAQQATGSFIAMDGGMEGQIVGQLPNASSSSLPTNAWARSSATGKVTVRNVFGTGGRSGNNFISINDTSTTSSTNLLTPSVSSGAIIGGNTYIVQFYYRASDLTTLPNTNINIGLSNASGTSVTQTLWTPNATTNNAVWLKSVNIVTAANAAIASNGYGVFRISSSATINGKAIDLDDWAVYAGNTVDNIAPSNPGIATTSSPTESTLTVSWGASANVDAGGYIVVRYTANPAGQSNPNVNGIYSVGNNIGSGVVAYAGINTSFLDKQLNQNTNYWYSVYTVDKAFNYSNFSSVNGSTNNTASVIKYFIDATNGNDANDGLSELTAWKTIAKVNATTFAPGDSILFKGGEVWTGTTLHPLGSGTSSKRIVVSKYGTGNLPRINADGNGLHNENGVFLYNQEYITISDLEITNNYAATMSDTAVAKGVYVQANNKGKVSCITLKNLVVHDVLGTYDFTNESGGIFCNITGTSTVTYFDSLLIDGCKVYNVDKIGISNQSTWDGRDMNGDYGATPWRPSTNYIVQNCRVDSSGGNSLIVRDSKGALIQNNIFWKSSKRYSGNAMFTFNCDDALIQYNEAAFNVYNPGDVDASGFDGDYRCKRTVFQYNYSHDNDGGFAVVVCQPGGIPARFDDSTVFRYNISQNDGHFNGGINNEGQIISMTGQITNTFFYNNTIYSSNDFNYAIIHRAWGGSGSIMPTNTYYYNNIFYINKPNPLYAFGSSTNTIFNYNTFYQPLGGTNPIDPHVLKTNPNFVNPGSGLVGLNTLDGYKLQNNSPAINSGRTIVGAPTKDFFGNIVATGATDRGAFESAVVVPVALTMFKGEKAGNINKLTWNTFTESNNAFFDVEKSNDESNFKAFATVNSQAINGNSSTPLLYQFKDEKPLNNITYYRLKQVDKNGLFKYSNTISIKSETKSIAGFEVYPNPVVSKEITITTTNILNGNYAIKLVNNLGIIALNKTINIVNNQDFKLPLPKEIITGIYYIQLVGNNIELSKQIIIK